VTGSVSMAAIREGQPSDDEPAVALIRSSGIFNDLDYITDRREGISSAAPISSFQRYRARDGSVKNASTTL
jgi:hypothetical protein